MTVNAGDMVKTGDTLFTASVGGADITVGSPIDGRVDSVAIASGSALSEGLELAVIVGGSGGVAAPKAAAPAPAARPAAPAAPKAAAPAAPAAGGTTGSSAPAGGTPVNANLPGTVLNVLAKEGQQVSEGEIIMTIESMKMEIEIPATAAGTIASIAVAPGAQVSAGDLLATIG